MGEGEERGLEPQIYGRGKKNCWRELGREQLLSDSFRGPTLTSTGPATAKGNEPLWSGPTRQPATATATVSSHSACAIPPRATKIFCCCLRRPWRIAGSPR